MGRKSKAGRNVNPPFLLEGQVWEQRMLNPGRQGAHESATWRRQARRQAGRHASRQAGRQL